MIAVTCDSCVARAAGRLRLLRSFVFGLCARVFASPSQKKSGDVFIPPAHTTQRVCPTSCRKRRGGARCVPLESCYGSRRGAGVAVHDHVPVSSSKLSVSKAVLRAYLYVRVQRGARRAEPERPACARAAVRGVWCHAAMGLAECHGTSWCPCRPPRHCSAVQEPPSVCVFSCWMINPIACERARIRLKGFKGKLEGLGRSRRGRSRGGQWEGGGRVSRRH